MRQPSENDDVGDALLKLNPITQIERLRTRDNATLARGHAAREFLLLFVTGLGAMAPCVHLVDVGLATVVMNAAKRSVASRIASVSGCAATPAQGDSNGASSTRLNVVDRIAGRRQSTHNGMGDRVGIEHPVVNYRAFVAARLCFGNLKGAHR
jgi:hypothetical protein